MKTALLLDQPDLLSPGRSRRKQFGREGGERIAILNGRGRDFEGGGGSSDLSLKWMVAGSADYRSDGKSFRLGGVAQLLLNPGQPYHLRFRGRSESLTIFFSRALADAAWAAVTAKGNRFPEFPTLAAPSPTALQKQFAGIYAESNCDEPDGATLEESSLALLAEIASLAQTRREQAGRIPALRGTTRNELLRRLARAESYLGDTGHRATLKGAAAAAALSPFHLIRIFRAVYRETPLAYATGKRLDRARDALHLTADTIEDIARRAGYESRTAFDRAFQRRFGVTPGAVRLPH